MDPWHAVPSGRSFRSASYRLGALAGAREWPTGATDGVSAAWASVVVGLGSHAHELYPASRLGRGLVSSFLASGSATTLTSRLRVSGPAMTLRVSGWRALGACDSCKRRDQWQDQIARRASSRSLGLGGWVTQQACVTRCDMLSSYLRCRWPLGGAGPGMSSGIVWHSNVSCIRVGGTPLAVEPKRGVTKVGVVGSHRDHLDTRWTVQKVDNAASGGQKASRGGVERL